jgi:outer membrane protein assembly factor BamB
MTRCRRRLNLKHPFSPGRLGLLLTLALALAACSAQPSTATWPGLAANDHLAFAAANQFVYAVNLTGDNFGKEAWRFPKAADSNMGTFSASPAVDANIVIAAADGPTSTYSGIVFGLDPETGEQRWCLALDTKAAKRISCPQAPSATASGPFGITLSTDDRVMDRLVIAGDTTYFGLNSGMVYAVDTKAGSVKWTFQAQQAVWAAPLVDDTNNVVYVGSLDHNLYALTRTTGALLWKKDLGAAVASQPAQVGDVLYVGTFGDQVFALNAKDGSKKWSVIASNWVWGTPVIRDSMMYFADVGGAVYAVDAGTGATKWSVKPGDGLRAAPLVTADAVIVGDRNGKLFSLDRSTGSPTWPQPQTIKGQLLGAPLLISDTILLAPYHGDNLLVGYSLAGVQKIAYAPGK